MEQTANNATHAGDSASRNQPLFSVIIPLYNRASLICDALDSVRAQGPRPIQIVVVDDGSTDDGAARVEHWRDSYCDVALSLDLLQQPNGGASSARNLGLDHACGRYIQYLDSDDLLHPERFARLVELFESGSHDFIQTGFENRHLDDGSLLSSLIGPIGDTPYEAALKGSLGANTLRSTLRADLARAAAPWRTDMACFEDRDYMERAVIRASEPLALPDILATARRGGQSHLSSLLRSRQGRELRIACEQQLALSITDTKAVDLAVLTEFRSRLYGLAMRSEASRWPELAQRCGALADAVTAPLDALGRRRRTIWKLGFPACWLYERLGALKSWLRSVRQAPA